MLLLITSAHPTLQPRRTPSLGRLVQPRHFSSVEQTIRSGMPWASDNDCFQGNPAVFRLTEPCSSDGTPSAPSLPVPVNDVLGLVDSRGHRPLFGLDLLATQLACGFDGVRHPNCFDDPTAVDTDAQGGPADIETARDRPGAINDCAAEWGERFRASIVRDHDHVNSGCLPDRMMKSERV